MKLLIIVHSDYFEDDLNKCKTFNTVLACNLKKEFEANGVECLAVPGESWLGVKKRLKSTWAAFERDFDQQLLNQYENVLFVGAIPLKLAHASIIEYFKKNVKGLFAVCNEYKIKVHGDYLFYAMPEEGSENQIHIGPMFNSEYLFPEKQYKKLILHIDHYYPGRADWSDGIKLAVQQLENNPYFKNHWEGYELYYHSQKLDSIEQFNFYEKPPNIPFSELAEIYRKSHIGFVSHRETLGMYPIEMAATGTMLATTPKMLAPSMFDYINYVNYTDNFWNEILPQINEEQAKKNAAKVEKLSYKNGVKRILEVLQR